MSGLDKNRLRNKTISFRVSPEEASRLEARIKVCGMPKGEYFIQALLHNNITVVGGKYQSDRLSLELNRLKEELHRLGVNHSFFQSLPVLNECKILLDEIQNVIATNDILEQTIIINAATLSKPEDNLHSNKLSNKNTEA